MKAILKLHKVEKKHEGYVYSGLGKVEFKNYNEKGFFKEYTSTSKNKQTAEGFADDKGMLMHIDKEMQRAVSSVVM